MTRIAPPRVAAVLLCLTLILSVASQAQLAAGPGIADSTTNQSISTRTISFSGTLPGQLDGSLSVIFSIYPGQQGSTALWSETQVVQVVSEKYSVMLGATSAAGLPQDIFATDQAHWLGVQVNGAEKRFLLVSVPYAMKAVEAERLGGLLPSDFVTVAQLQSILQNSATQPTGSQPTAPSKTTGVQPQEVPAGTPAQPATDFTDNNASEVLLVTQQGTGFAIHAITSSQAEAILAQNDSIGGIALHALATNQTTSQTGPSVGVLAEVASPDGIAGEFNNRAGGKILSLRNNGVEVASADSNGNLTLTGQINGNGAGLIGIPPQAINATSINIPSTVVSRDSGGNFAANQISGGFFSGNGGGLFGIPPEGINATSINIPSTVVFRDSGGNFAANQISGGFFSGNGGGLFGIPPEGINATSINIPSTVVFRDSSGNFAANQISGGFFSGNGGGLFGIPPEGINATSINIPSTVVFRDSSGNFAANQISGGFFSGNGGGLFGIPPLAINATPINIPNSVIARDASGNFSTGFINASGLSASGSVGPVIEGVGGIGIQASTPSGIGLWAGATANDSTGTALLLSHASLGKLIRGGVGTSTVLANESFSLDAAGNVSFNGGMMTPYETSGTWVAKSLVKLTSNPGDPDTPRVTMTSPGDTSGAIGIITGLGIDGSKIQVAQSGQYLCTFDGASTIGHYVGISKTIAGNCTDIGPNYPNDGQQVVGRILSSFGEVLLFQSELHNNAGGGVTINTGTGLIGGPITSSGTISIANGGVTNPMLQNSSVSVTLGTGLSGGGVVSLGGSVTLNNTGALSFNGRAGNVLPAQGDYSFSQLNGAVLPTQLPAAIVYNNQGNDFSGHQVITGTAGVNDFSASGGQPALASFSQNNVAGSFISNGPFVLTAGNTTTGGLFSLTNSGVLTVTGNVFGSSFIGDGSRLTNVNAASVGGVAVANLATTSALGAETVARQSGDTSLQNNINAETAARASADSSLQANINAVSAASAQLSAANTFTAKQTLAASTASAASLNIPAGTAPSTPAAGDVWNTGTTVQFRDTASTTRSLVSTTQSGGLQLLKLTASITPSNVSSQACTEQTFTVSGIAPGDVILNVLQPSTSSPGTNIGIGSFRVTTANSLIISFCNVGKNNATPTAGTYTFALMR